MAKSNTGLTSNSAYTKIFLNGTGSFLNRILCLEESPTFHFTLPYHPETYALIEKFFKK